MELIRLSFPIDHQQAVAEIMICNDETARFGLILSHREALQLVESRNTALKSNGRIEFGGDVIGKIIRMFCDSPYISGHNYPEILHELIEIFYFYKNETLDLIGDDDLIQYMKTCFDGKCQGSLELLRERELAGMARNLRYGYALNLEAHRKNGGEDGDEDGDGEY